MLVHGTGLVSFLISLGFVNTRRLHPGHTRIVGGHPVKHGERPYQLDLSFQNSSHLCGATLVLAPGMGQQIGVTAAHCVTYEASTRPVDSNEFLVKAGATGINEKGEQLNITRVIVHPGYKPLTKDGSRNDIALLFFQGQFNLSRNIEPMALPKQGQKTFGNVSVSGWGALNSKHEDDASTVLREVDMPVITSRTCNILYTDGKNNTMIYPTNFCAGYKEGNRTTCSGDSGGPVIGNNTGQSYLAGVVSWGNKICEAPKSPAVFTRVSAYIKWITAEVQKHTQRLIF